MYDARYVIQNKRRYFAVQIPTGMHKAVKETARLSGLTVASWIRAVLVSAINDSLKRHGQPPWEPERVPTAEELAWQARQDTESAAKADKAQREYEASMKF